MGREINQLLGRIFAQRHKDGRTDLEAIETAVRSTVHRAGAAALTALLQFPAPAAGPRSLPCSCGQAAHYEGLRSKPLLTVVGGVEVSRPYYLCPGCHAGQFPADVELDIENTGFSPGVRRMQALVGQEAPFDQGRKQMKVLAGLEVTEVRDLAQGDGDLPASDVLVLRLNGLGRVVLRPSGTEPKLKVYLEATTGPCALEDLPEARRSARARLEELRREVAGYIGAR